MSVHPYLLYADVDAAIAWLARVFGLTPDTRMPGPDGRTSHAEVYCGGDLIMMGCPGGGYRNPRALGAVTALVFATVPDVDAHFARAKAAGAEIVSGLEDKPYGRTYAAKDPEGHQWHFVQEAKEA